MTLDVLLLQKLAKWRCDKDRQTLEVADAETGWTAAVTADCADLVGCRIWELALRRSTPLTDDLKARAEHVAERVTGLLEPLRLVEVDAPRGVALLRSEQPGHWGEGLYYYEALIQADGTTSVRRYQAPHEGEPRRHQLAFALTHEALAKLVADLTAA